VGEVSDRYDAAITRLEVFAWLGFLSMAVNVALLVWWLGRHLRWV
jgi:hypothetical protein